jgi:large subunit ribosomal protein L24
MNRIRKGDRVIVTRGPREGPQGTVIRVLEDDHVLVENVNMVKKHQKPNPQLNRRAGSCRRRRRCTSRT